MAKSNSKTLSGLKLNIFQKSDYQINLTIQNPYDGKDFQWSSVEHSEKHHGKQKARTHNNLFTYFKSVLDANGLWKDMETKLGKTRGQDEEIDLSNKHGFIYLTTNLVNGMKYVGKHSNFGDDYLGSGTEFKKAVEEYGKDNFEREIIAFAYTPEQLNELEKMYIDTFNAVNDPNFYNLAPGGDAWYEKAAK